MTATSATTPIHCVRGSVKFESTMGCSHAEACKCLNGHANYMKIPITVLWGPLQHHNIIFCCAHIQTMSPKTADIGTSCHPKNMSAELPGTRPERSGLTTLVDLQLVPPNPNREVDGHMLHCTCPLCANSMFRSVCMCNERLLAIVIKYASMKYTRFSHTYVHC